MNSFQKKIEEKKLNLNKRPKDKKEGLLKTKKYRMQHTKKNAQFGMF